MRFSRKTKGCTYQMDAQGLCVADIMNKRIVAVQAGTLLGDAAHMMVINRISGLPVVDEQESLIGVITEADFLRALGVPCHHPTHSLWQTLEAMFAHNVEMVDVNYAVSNLMVEDVITVAPDTSVCDVVDILKKNKIKRVVVCDEHRRVLGIVTRTDLVRIFFDRMRSASDGNNP